MIFAACLAVVTAMSVLIIAHGVLGSTPEAATFALASIGLWIALWGMRRTSQLKQSIANLSPVVDRDGYREGDAP